MIEIFGPTYRYNGEILTKPEVLYVNDHHYQEDTKQWHLKTLLENSAVDPKEHLIAFDHMHHDDVLKDYEHVCLPGYVTRETQDFIDAKIQPNINYKTHIFNFMINKPRLSRQLLLILIDKFKLKNFLYTLPWRTNPYSNLKPSSYKFGIKRQFDQGIQQGDINNAQTYIELLQKNIFEPTCVSLITEPSFIEKETMHTEKTLMAIYSATLPIWVGGWRLASTLRDMGFDVFDDVVDHGYETYDDPWDRAYYAIEKNIDLLRNFKRAESFIRYNRKRFRKNIRLVEQNPFRLVCETVRKNNPRVSTLWTDQQSFTQVLGRE